MTAKNWTPGAFISANTVKMDRKERCGINLNELHFVQFDSFSTPLGDILWSGSMTFRCRDPLRKTLRVNFKSSMGIRPTCGRISDRKKFITWKTSTIWHLVTTTDKKHDFWQNTTQQNRSCFYWAILLKQTQDLTLKTPWKKTLKNEENLKKWKKIMRIIQKNNQKWDSATCYTGLSRPKMFCNGLKVTLNWFC